MAINAHDWRLPVKVQLRALGFDLTGSLSEYVGRRVHFALGRLGGQPVLVFAGEG